MKKEYFFAMLLCIVGQVALAQKSTKSVVQQHFNVLEGESHFKAADLAQFKITDEVPSLNPNVKHVYVQQMYNNVPIQYGTYKFTVTNGEISWYIDQFVGNVAEKVTASSPSITAENAVLKTAQSHQLRTPVLSGSRNAEGIYVYNDPSSSLAPIKVQLMYQLYKGELRLVWNVSFYQLDGQHWWNENIDATTGRVLRTEDWVVSCNFGTPDHTDHDHTNTTKEVAEMGPVPYAMTSVDATLVGGGSYNVYPLGIESPNHGNRAIVTDPANATASPFGWHDTNGAAGAEFTTTRGNNVLAQDDTNGNNGSGATPDGGSGLDFDFPLNLNNNPSTFLPAATTNLFYWNNIMHDVWYQYGFNEASGNFQENNYGKGGLGSDSVFADAQDGSGTNNANFGTPPDGQNPRMQMFLFTNPTRDGDLDNVIIAHEYGHGISTRLVGGPGTNALGGTEQMGEGWSDWFGLVMTIRPGDNRNTARGVGTYAIGQATDGAGIRPTRYSTDFAVNGTDYNDVPSLVVPHGVGYGFATILWDMTWDLIDQEGYDNNQYTGTGGNNIAMALVTEGLKNTANNPGYVSGRDGIIQADQDLYGGQYNCLIWDAFAKRGVGVDAVENTNGGTNTNNDQTASFTSGCTGGGTPDACSGTVSSFPETQSFETNLGTWTNSTSDNIDWTRDTAGTPSANTGPTTGADGATYIYVEASDPNFPNKRALLNSPCYNLSGENAATFNFSYHMFGAADMGSIDLEVSTDDGTTWASIWNRTGNQGNQWNTESVNLNTYAGQSNVRLRFNRVTGSTWQADIALDAFNFEGGTVADTQAPSVPVNLSVSNVTETTLNLNWNASTDNVAVTGYEIFQDGASVGTIAGTAAAISNLTAATSYSFTVRAFDAAGNNSAQSNSVNATTLGGGGGGNCTGGVGAPYSESFESSIGAWTQDTANDNINWTRDSGGTPSNGTGPSSGSNGSWYMYVEASGNGDGFPNRRAILNSPCLDLSGETAANFNFDYHMFGSTDGGRVDLEASTDGSTWTSLWNAQGNDGNQWNAVTVSLDAYAGVTVQLRFNRITGGTWQSDVAIDNISLTAGGGGGNPPTGYCASNGNNTSDEYIQRVQLGSIDNATGASAGGYGDFTNLSTNLSASNSITITPLWTGTVYNEAYAVFVDWNRDGDFGDAGELAFSQAPTQSTSISGSFNVPAGASAGPTRMRVSMKYNAAQTACESFQWGEVEDYIVVIPSSLQGFAGPGNPSINTTNAVTVSGFSIWPNPVNRGTLNIKVLDAEATNYVIHNLVGQKVLAGAYSNTIDVSSLASGVYIIEVDAGSQKFIERFIKE